MGLIYLDACLVIYLVQQNGIRSERMVEMLESTRDTRYAISPLVKMECLVGPVRHADLALERMFTDAFERFEMVDMPGAVFLQAAQLRGRFGLKTPDALHLACAQHHACEALWTTDDRLHQASHGLARMILKP